MELAVNSVLHYYAGAQQTQLEVVLWLESKTDMIVTYELNQKNALPIIKKLSNIQSLLASREISVIENPYSKSKNESDIDEKYIKIRDSRWNIIKNIITQEPAIYINDERSTLIKNLMIEKNMNRHQEIYKYLRIYWQYGKVQNSLLPNYNFCGGRNKDKISGELKRGRQSESNKGINVNEDIKKIIEKSYNQYYKNTNEFTLTKAYQCMLEKYFIEGYYANEQGNLVPLIKTDKAPSLRQFTYWGKKMFSTKDILLSRKGEREFNLNKRAVLGESTSEAFAPGRHFQVDATIADIHLVSRLNNNWIIGRPVVYMVIDVFSRKIVGFYVGLEGPSWLGGMMAIYNTTRNKVDLCNEYGISITPEDWMCNYLPENIIVDRGEFESNKTANLKANLGVNIKILPPFRADWKGIVEQNFRKLNNKTIHWLPGKIKREFRIRGEEDYRLGAMLNLYEFTQIIIHSILYFNSSYMNYYKREPQMIKDNVPEIPNELWKWGIKNRSGSLKTFNEDIIKLNLMPSKECSITERGILFQNSRYSCQEAIESGIFEHVRKYGRIKTLISYDPRNPNNIYINEGNKFIKLSSLDEKYNNLYYEELESLKMFEKLEKDKHNMITIQNTANLNANIDNIISSARKREKESIYSNKKLIENIRDNRKNEKEFNRYIEAWELDKKQPHINQAKVLKINDDKDLDDDYVARPNYTDIVSMNLESENINNE